MDNLISKASIFLLFTGCFGVFGWLVVGAYITKKWMAEIAEILEDRPTFFTTSIILGLQGTLQYATVFFWSFHAKRYGMLERRKLVPKHIQKWYIFSYCLFMVSVLFFSIGAFLIFLFLDGR